MVREGAWCSFVAAFLAWWWCGWDWLSGGVTTLREFAIYYLMAAVFLWTLYLVMRWWKESRVRRLTALKAAEEARFQVQLKCHVQYLFDNKLPPYDR